MLCFRSSMLVRSFTVNNISVTRHQPLMRAIRNLFVFVEYCRLLEFYVKCAALYRTFIPQPFWNARCGRPRGSKFHLTRSLVASEGWSLVRDRTNRKHCPSHEIWSYKRDGRCSPWARGRTFTYRYHLWWQRLVMIFIIGHVSAIYFDMIALSGWQLKIVMSSFIPTPN